MKRRLRRHARGGARRGCAPGGWKAYARLLEEMLGPELTAQRALEVLKSRGFLMNNGRYACHLYGGAEPMLISRLVMMAGVRGPLAEGAEVHHINGNRADDRPENLALMESNAEHVLVDGRGAGMKWMDVGKGRGLRLKFTCGPYRGLRACRGVLGAAIGGRIPRLWNVRALDGDEGNIRLENLAVVSMHVRLSYEHDKRTIGVEEEHKRFVGYVARWPECRGQGFVDWYAAQTAALGKRPERAPGGRWRRE